MLCCWGYLCSIHRKKDSRFCLAPNFYHCSTSMQREVPRSVKDEQRATYILFIRPCLTIVKQRIWSLVAFWIALAGQLVLSGAAVCTLSTVAGRSTMIHRSTHRVAIRYLVAIHDVQQLARRAAGEVSHLGKLGGRLGKALKERQYHIFQIEGSWLTGYCKFTKLLSHGLRLILLRTLDLQCTGADAIGSGSEGLSVILFFWEVYNVWSTVLQTLHHLTIRYNYYVRLEATHHSTHLEHQLQATTYYHRVHRSLTDIYTPHFYKGWRVPIPAKNRTREDGATSNAASYPQTGVTRMWNRQG
ncbi:hypothetical protein EDC04DRAFT_768724 [Pisolithus marmoratus]|nr:hypothetical protein EDC04DRAFT_768724 [Pisolithus marmoratus]